MPEKKMQIIIVVIFALLLGSTVAFAFFDGSFEADTDVRVLSKNTSGVPAGGSVKQVKPVNPPPTGTSLADILRAKGISGAIPDVNILVDKSSHLLTLRSGDTPLKSYRVAISQRGLGDKNVSGDNKTPEGEFTIVERYPMAQDRYLGTRWMRLSYPNIEDAKRGLQTGIINQETYQAIVDAAKKGTTPPQRTALGGGVGIHGGRDTNDRDKDWTWGCVALYKHDVEEMYDYTPIGTRVVIQK